MFAELDGVPEQVPLEHEMLAFWKERGIFEKLRARNRGGERFSFLDGPITANNPMGVHHAWGRTLKDAWQRYWAMRGRDQRYQNGFDCQGLWVEVEVERELGFTSKRDIERFGVAEFVDRCRARTQRFADLITEESVRLGCWMDWDDSYRTDSEQNNYAIWHFLHACHERGLIYRGRDVMPWCPRCGTGLSQQEVQEAYKEVTHTGLVVRLPVRDREHTYLLVWTTTPWTLTANVACAVNPGLTYAEVQQGEATYYLAAGRVAETMTADMPYRVVREFPGGELVGLHYAGPFDDLPLAQEAHRVVPWREVSQEEGTGLVHTAPGCGKEDYELAREHGLPALGPIDENGVLLPSTGRFAGQPASGVAEAVRADLQARGLLYRADPYLHRYPHCWRCGTEALFRLVDEWFIAMDPWREEIARSAEQVTWVPGYGREVELDWLRNMRDWMISKKRYWGLALPIWTCECGWFDVVSGKEELQARAVAGWEEFAGRSPHRPYVDAVQIRCEQCGGAAHRIPDVGNPWLDAGIVPFSTMGYFEDREEWARWFPAELVIENLQGQFRNWFYALLAMSTQLEGCAPVRTIAAYSTVLDAQGEEMHKSKGNAIWFSEAADKVGADIVRWRCASHPMTQPLRFGWADAEPVRAQLNTLWNVYGFLAMYANVDGWPGEGAVIDTELAAPLDRWLRARVKQTAQEVEAGMVTIDPPRATTALSELLDDLSNWWVRRSRRRFWGGKGEEKAQAYQVLYGALRDLCALLAPFLPFTAEALYQRLAAPFASRLLESVHLCALPEGEVTEEEVALVAECTRARAAVRAGRAARAAANLRVRQPLAAARVLSVDGAPPFPHFAQDVLEELNVKRLDAVTSAELLGEARSEDGGVAVGLDTVLTEELRQEGVARDLVRHVQNLRKRAGLRVEQRIRLWLAVEDGPVGAALQTHRESVAAETLAVELHLSAPPDEASRAEAKVGGERVVLGVRAVG
jgi:isoleucyl-tRNA synthetase